MRSFPSFLIAVLAAMPLLAVTAAAEVHSAGWVQFLGPTRNGVYPGNDVLDVWPAHNPAVLWRLKTGQGWSGPVVSDGKVVLFHRVEDKERIDCLETLTGKLIWTAQYPTGYQDDFGFDEGPRATPTISDASVYTFGAEGALHCWSLDTGKEKWGLDTKERFKQSKGFFGMAGSPLIEGGSVILNIGGRGAGVVAFDKSNGKILWQATDDEAGYSSPIAATFNGKRYLIAFTRAGLDGLDPSSGKVYFRFPWRSPMNASVNAATPLVIDDTIFVSACYDTGAALLQFREHGPEKIWSGDDILSNHYSTSVYHKGFLFGFDGRQEQGQHLRCVDLKTGKVRWSQDDFGAGTLILAGDRLLILTEKGQLMEALADPDGFKPIGQMQLVGFGTRSNAALAKGLYYARGKNELVCVDLRRHE